MSDTHIFETRQDENGYYVWCTLCHERIDDDYVQGKKHIAEELTDYLNSINESEANQA